MGGVVECLPPELPPWMLKEKGASQIELQRKQTSKRDFSWMKIEKVKIT